MASDGPLKLLLVSDDPGAEEAVRPQLEEFAPGRTLELKVVVPIKPESGLDLFTGEVDEPIAEAEQRAEDTADAGEEAGDVSVVETEAGDADRLLAIEDALATFDADRIVLVDPDGELLADAKERFTIPVEELDES